MQHYRQRRTITDLDVTVARGEDAWRARISNATQEGFRLKGDLPFKLDDQIEIRGSEWKVEGNVVWIKDGYVGISLNKPLPHSVFSRLTGKSVRLNRKSRVGFHHELGNRI